MHISRIELENIKSHVSASFDLVRGTTAITGPNGAGKSTIVEAVAWVLFDLLEYKKEDFVRRGNKKGSVKITFESGLDEREYVVFRDTAAAYNVTDPRLGLRIADKKEEVFRFLWKHLGLEPGTDLRSLFRQAIGVPQGTLTSIFLEGATERKVAFDRLLKVEEYRQAAEKLRETSRYIDQSVGRAREAIAHAEGVLTRNDVVREEHEDLVSQIKEFETEIAENRSRQASLQMRVAAFDDVEKRLGDLRAQVDNLRSRTESSRVTAERIKQDVERSKGASELVEASRASASRYMEVQGKFKELERERSERDRLREEFTKVETAILRVETERSRLTSDLEVIQAAHAEIERITPEIARQEALEKELADLRETLTAARFASQQASAVDVKLEKLRESFRENKDKIRRSEEMARPANDLPELETRDAELMKHLAEMRASLERDEKFQSEIKGGLCPVLSQKCLNLSDGQTLEGFITSQFTEVRSHIAELESEKSRVGSLLTAARSSLQHAANLAGYRQRESEMTQEGADLQEERKRFERQASALAETDAAIASADSQLKTMGDPRSRVRFLEDQLGREPVVRQGLSDTESNLERLNSERNRLQEQLEAYRSLDETWEALSAESDSTVDAYRVFLANETESKALKEREAALDAAKAEHTKLAADLSAAESELEEERKGYDAEQHAAERTALRELENVFHSTNARLEAAKHRLAVLAAELERFAAIRKTLQDELQEKDRLEAIAATTAFIRDTLKEAAPQVARNYVYHVSVEANQLFREISGNAERTLKWAEDYSIMLEEDGYERPFVSLSGGEQMAAALAVRLGLLKQLTDIRIAFFDEPTANMDAERRDNLGQQISRISHFDQLIVISHDDTFDSYVDNVISLG